MVLPRTLSRRYHPTALPRKTFGVTAPDTPRYTVRTPASHQGNKQLRRHWKAWVKEEDIAQMATVGINTVRLPVGDWMYQPYGPYVGCTDGALDEVDRLFELCRRWDLEGVLLYACFPSPDDVLANAPRVAAGTPQPRLGCALRWRQSCHGFQSCDILCLGDGSDHESPVDVLSCGAFLGFLTVLIDGFGRVLLSSLYNSHSQAYARETALLSLR